ncbi:hypothetical protein P1X14_12475 [Sphingomonas sp. AOB5]|uniref:hypothetical protein n=1 Tax=Sphingomonas sp. AOB5 TaxID=3034017 RepID=UPI0023F8FC67|nr:hypothetical protein [Sphingomonas sp. AOB5]MDF7776066.1 hypothetical protein [Sphingomonas sp. AOB5]
MSGIRAGVTSLAAVALLAGPSDGHAPQIEEAGALCPTVRSAIDLARIDPDFVRIQARPVTFQDNEVPATLRIDGFDCEVYVPVVGIEDADVATMNGMDDGTRYPRAIYACSRYDLPDGKGGAEAERLALQLSQCLDIVPERSAYPGSSAYSFTLPGTPETGVFVSGNGLKNEGVLVNVIRYLDQRSRVAANFTLE